MGLLHANCFYLVPPLLIDKSSLWYGQEVNVRMVQEVVFDFCLEILDYTLYKLFLKVPQWPCGIAFLLLPYEKLSLQGLKRPLICIDILK